MIDYEPISERSLKIIEMRNNDKTFREIGEYFHISTERARQLYKKALQRKEFNNSVPDDIFLKCLYDAQIRLNLDYKLVTRTYLCLARHGFLVEPYDLERIFNLSDEQLLQLRQFGIKGLKLLRTAQDIYYSKPVS